MSVKRIFIIKLSILILVVCKISGVQKTCKSENLWYTTNERTWMFLNKKKYIWLGMLDVSLVH